MPPKVSVIVPTARYGGMDILRSNLRKQIFRDFELVLVDKLWESRLALLSTYFDFPVKHIQDPPPVEGDVWNLCRAYNEAVRASSGEILVFLQDYIWVPGDGLERFVNALEALGKGAIVTGCGHKAAEPSSLEYPKGLVTTFLTEFTQRPTGIWERDGRMNNLPKELCACAHDWFELNWSAMWRSTWQALGGIDPAYGSHYGCDNLDIAERAKRLGFQFYIDGGNECIGFPHQKYWLRPVDWESQHSNKGFHAQMIAKLDSGERPLRVIME